MPAKRAALAVNDDPGKPNGDRARSREYRARQDRIGVKYVQAMIPEDRSLELQVITAGWRYVHFKRLLDRGEAADIVMLSRRNVPTVPPILPFEAFVEGVPALLEGGTQHKTAVHLYNDTVAAIRELSRTRADMGHAAAVEEADNISTAVAIAVVAGARLSHLMVQREHLIDTTRDMLA